jgi:hypothetical protein
MKTRVLSAVILMSMLWAGSAGAQKFEITPFAGFRFGGEAVDETGISYDLEATGSFGLGLEFAMSESARVQLLLIGF